jgi:FkbM family methyltransferase
MINLPEWLETINFPQVDSRVKLVVAKMRGQFDSILESQAHIGENAALIIATLAGTGTLIDVGANIGSIALVVAATGSNVIAVEMVPENVAKLSFGMLANGLGSVRIIHAAASDEEVVLNYAGGEAWASISETGSHALALRIDTILEMSRMAEPDFVTDPIFLKIDVEGHEANVLEGSALLITKHQPTILFEAIDFPGDAGVAAQKAKNWLHNAGYDLFLTRDDILIPCAPTDIQIGLVCDFLAVPKGRGPVIPGYRVDALSSDATKTWLLEMLRETEVHRAHALKVVRALPAASFAKSVLEALSESPEEDIRSEALNLLDHMFA